MPLDWAGIQNLLGLQLPQDDGFMPTELDIKNYYDQQREKRKQETKDSVLKRVGDTALGFLGGIVGLEPEPRADLDYTPEELGSIAGNIWPDLKDAGPAVIKAGLPFAAYVSKGKIPHGYLKHGSPRARDLVESGRFDLSGYDRSDVMGAQTHAEPSGPYASDYAMGQAKHSGLGGRSGSAVIPLVPEAKNVLDLLEPNMDDMAAAVGQLEPYARKNLIERYKNLLQLSKEENPNLYSLQSNFSSHINPYTIAREDLPAKFLADQLRLPSSTIEEMPFDAIRYRDMGHESWAFPARTPLKGAFGGHDFTPVPPRKNPRFLIGPEGIEEVDSHYGQTPNWKQPYKEEAPTWAGNTPIQDIPGFEEGNFQPGTYTIQGHDGEFEVNIDKMSDIHLMELKNAASKDKILSWSAPGFGKKKKKPDNLMTGDFEKTQENIIKYYNEYNDDWNLVKEWVDTYHPNYKPWINKSTGELELILKPASKSEKKLLPEEWESEIEQELIKNQTESLWPKVKKSALSDPVAYYKDIKAQKAGYTVDELLADLDYGVFESPEMIDKFMELMLSPEEIKKYNKKIPHIIDLITKAGLYK